MGTTAPKVLPPGIANEDDMERSGFCQQRSLTRHNSAPTIRPAKSSPGPKKGTQADELARRLCRGIHPRIIHQSFDERRKEVTSPRLETNGLGVEAVCSPRGLSNTGSRPLSNGMLTASVSNERDKAVTGLRFQQAWTWKTLECISHKHRMDEEVMESNFQKGPLRSARIARKRADEEEDRLLRVLKLENKRQSVYENAIAIDQEKRDRVAERNVRSAEQAEEHVSQMRHLHSSRKAMALALQCDMSTMMESAKQHHRQDSRRHAMRRSRSCDSLKVGRIA